MTPEEMNQARLDLRERLRLLAIAWGDEMNRAKMPENISSGTLAEECMHMCSYFVIRGLGWNLEMFLEKTAEIYEIHKTLLKKEQQRKSELN